MDNIAQDLFADMDFLFGLFEDPVGVIADVIPPTCTDPDRVLICAKNHVHNDTCVDVNQVSSSGQSAN